MDDAWIIAQSQAITRTFQGVPGVTLDPFQKLLSQAFAEASKGDVYLFTPTGYDALNPAPGYISAWSGWEYPALARNPDVTVIYRVDPSDTANDRTVVWTQGDPPSPNPPLGLNNAPRPP